MESQLKAGDVVKLKSGGPKMTLRGWDGNRHGFVCSWFYGDELREGLFSLEQLESVN